MEKGRGGVELEHQRGGTKPSLTRGGTKDGREEPGHRSVPLTLCFSGTDFEEVVTHVSFTH